MLHALQLEMALEHGVHACFPVAKAFTYSVAEHPTHWVPSYANPVAHASHEAPEEHSLQFAMHGLQLCADVLGSLLRYVPAEHKTQAVSVLA